MNADPTPEHALPDAAAAPTVGSSMPGGSGSSETASAGFDLSTALGSARADDEEGARAEVVFEADRLSVFYGDFQAVRDVSMQIPRQGDHGVHRSLGLREDDTAAQLQTA